MRAARSFATAAFAVAVNSLSVVALSGERRGSPRSVRVRLILHSALILPGWLRFGAELRALEPQRSRRSARRPETALGITFEVMGWMMVMAGFRVLGPGALVNADLFESHAMPRSREGIYAVLGQPIYTGYGLIVFGRGVRRGHPMLAALGPWLSFLLVAVLAPAENCAFRRSSSHDNGLDSQ